MSSSTHHRLILLFIKSSVASLLNSKYKEPQPPISSSSELPSQQPPNFTIKLQIDKTTFSSCPQNSSNLQPRINNSTLRQQMNKTMLPTIASHCPGGTSVYTVLQYAQEIKHSKMDCLFWIICLAKQMTMVFSLTYTKHELTTDK